MPQPNRQHWASTVTVVAHYGKEPDQYWPNVAASVDTRIVLAHHTILQ